MQITPSSPLISALSSLAQALRPSQAAPAQSALPVTPASKGSEVSGQPDNRSERSRSPAPSLGRHVDFKV